MDVKEEQAMQQSRQKKASQSKAYTQSSRQDAQAASGTGREPQGILWMRILRHDTDMERRLELSNTRHSSRRMQPAHVQYLHEQDGASSREVGTPSVDELLRDGDYLECRQEGSQDQSGHYRCHTRPHGSHDRQACGEAQAPSGRTRVHRRYMVSQRGSGIRLHRKADRVDISVGVVRGRRGYAYVAQEDTLHCYETPTSRHNS